MQKLLQFEIGEILPSNKIKYPHKMRKFIFLKAAIFRYSEHYTSIKNAQFLKF